MLTSTPDIPVIKPVSDSLNIRILAANCGSIDDRWNYNITADPFWRLYVNGSAGASLVMSDETYVLSPDRIHLVPPYLRFKCRCVGSVPHFFICFEVEQFTPNLIRRVFCKPLTVLQDAGLEQAAQRMWARLNNQAHNAYGVADQAAARSLVYGAVEVAVRSLSPEQATLCDDRVIGAERVRPAIELVSRRLASPIYVDDLAATCHLSREQFVRVFRQSLGQSPIEYVLTRRLSLAAHLLESTELSIDEIATRVGFANRYYFTRRFTTEFHVPPATYREHRTHTSRMAK